MKLEILKLRETDQEYKTNLRVFRNLLQAYEYEFSNITKIHADAEGVFVNKELEENIQAKACDIFLFRADGEWAGFAVINKKSYLNDDKEVRDVGEFFIVKLLRRKKIGYKISAMLFDLYPGKWEIRQLPAAREAREFWRRVLDHYTRHNYKELDLDHPRWKGSIMFFTLISKRKFFKLT